MAPQQAAEHSLSWVRSQCMQAGLLSGLRRSVHTERQSRHCQLRHCALGAHTMAQWLPQVPLCDIDRAAVQRLAGSGLSCSQTLYPGACLAVSTLHWQRTIQACRVPASCSCGHASSLTKHILQLLCGRAKRLFARHAGYVKAGRASLCNRYHAPMPSKAVQRVPAPSPALIMGVCRAGCSCCWLVQPEQAPSPRQPSLALSSWCQSQRCHPSCGALS